VADLGAIAFKCRYPAARHLGIYREGTTAASSTLPCSSKPNLDLCFGNSDVELHERSSDVKQKPARRGAYPRGLLDTRIPAICTL
jgi:hypothetical protein